MLHLPDFNICYIHSSLSKLGLMIWVPNLNEQADSLAKSSSNCPQTCKLLMAPRQVIKVIKPVQAHSDDKYLPKKQIYLVKKLPFRSEPSNTFFRRLNDVMKDSGAQDTKCMPGRHCLQVKNGLITIFPKAPKGLPLEFYNVNWFNNKLSSQHQNFANIDSVAFLPDPLNSLCSKALEKKKKTRHPKMMKEAIMGEELIYRTPMGKRMMMRRMMTIRVERDADEEYEEFEKQDEEICLENLGKGTYSGGLADSNWNTWQ
ncbi:hypothetical protein VP01_4006g1 [Puccinia sorghi]|uniref:Uncharacterized protein n=1 Tax=Puccinia sorghi TaxID=27349 RepID=A0A0L6URY2_9BASI|nr:hypothetical protein VP01_4006g1 [Puccinia sorghi]